MLSVDYILKDPSERERLNIHLTPRIYPQWSVTIKPNIFLLIRPPVRSNGRTYKMLVMFLFFQRVISELPRPITAKLRHMIGTGVYFIN